VSNRLAGTDLCFVAAIRFNQRNASALKHDFPGLAACAALSSVGGTSQPPKLDQTAVDALR
jgi:hypothetical protein